jgi:uncharacterized lipoprotein YddW (UPF0748 family)
MDSCFSPSTRPIRPWTRPSLAAFCLLACLPGNLLSEETGAATRPDEPFLGAYVHMGDLLKGSADSAARVQVIGRNLDRFKAAALRVVMPYVTTTRGTAAYASTLVPGRDYADWDPLEVIMAEARKRGLRVWPVVCVVSSGHDEPRGILARHPEWALRDTAGKPIGYLSPCHSQARQWIVSVLKEIASRYGPDCILLDYLRFPNQVVQLDPDSAARFEKACPASATPAQRKRLMQEFKEQGLTELARQISEGLRAARPGIQVGMYSWGAHVARSHPVAQCWPAWVAKGYVDMVSPSGYCYEKNCGKDYLKVFEGRMRDAMKIMEDLRVPQKLTFTLGVKTSHGQVGSAKDIEDYLRIARKVGVRGVAVFTWNYLDPYLDELVRNGGLARFAAP